MRRLLLALALCLAPLTAPAVEPGEMLADPALEARARALSLEGRAAGELDGPTTVPLPATTPVAPRRATPLYAEWARVQREGPAPLRDPLHGQAADAPLHVAVLAGAGSPTASTRSPSRGRRCGKAWMPCRPRSSMGPSSICGCSSTIASGSSASASR